MGSKNYTNVDLLTQKLWLSYLLGLIHGGKVGFKDIEDLNVIQVNKMLSLREEAIMIIEEIKLGLREKGSE